MNSQYPAKRRKLSPDAIRDGSGKPFSTPSRASFYTPTRASLARFNPDLLPQKSPEQVTIPENRRRNSIPLRLNGTTNGEPAHDGRGSPRRAQSVVANGNTDTSRASPIRARSATPRLLASPTKRQNSVYPRRSMTPFNLSLPKSPSKQRPQVAPNPPASPPLAASEARPGSEEALNAQLEPELQASTPSKEHNITPTARASKQLPRTQPNGEPDLPLSPAQLGLEPVPEAPKGMLFSSPRRLRRRKAGINSSPLKPTDVPPRLDVNKARAVVFDESLVQVEDSQTPRTQDNAKDPDLMKQRLLVEQLQTQVNALSNDIFTLETEIHRFQAPESQLQATRESNTKLL